MIVSAHHPRLNELTGQIFVGIAVAAVVVATALTLLGYR